MKIKAIIHDWDDTITNSFESYIQFYYDFGKFHELGDPDIDKIKKHWGSTVPEIVSGVWPGLDSKKAEEKTNIFMKLIKTWRKTYSIKVFPQIKETIAELDRLGIKLGVISSGDSQQIKNIYKKQIDRELRPQCFIFDNKELGYRKPDLRIFDKAFEILKQFNIEEEETIYIGDSFQDYHSAKNRNLKFYAVTTGVRTKNGFIREGLHPKYILANFNEILKLFQ